jgi:hypothetical protein
MKQILKEIVHELEEHLPFTALATFVGIIVSIFVIKLNY